VQDATTVTRTHLLFPWRELILHVRVDPDVVLHRVRAQLVSPAPLRLSWRGVSPSGTVRGNRIELSTHLMRYRVVLEGEVVGAPHAAIIRILIRPSKPILIFGGLWLGFATLGCAALAAYREPAGLAALLFPVVGYAFLFGRFPTLALRTLDWLTRVANSAESPSPSLRDT
jgi:hypothetical protein